MLYVKTDTSGQERISDCRTLLLEFDHPPLVKGQWVSNPDGQLIYDEGWREYIPPVIPPAPHDEPDMAEMVAAVKRMLASSVADLTDEQALAVASLFPTWKDALDKGLMVQAGERRWDNGKLWKCKQAHIPQDDWRPEDTPAMWYEVSIEEWPQWVQPIDSESAYPLGAHVSHNVKHWESEYDANTWEPGVFGWKEV